MPTTPQTRRAGYIVSVVESVPTWKLILIKKDCAYD